MSDDQKLSLLLDGRLPDEEARALRARIATDPALQEQYRLQRELLRLSRSLPVPGAGFEAEDIRRRAAVAPMGPTSSVPLWRDRRMWTAAAAVALLVLSHVFVYQLGTRERDPVLVDNAMDDAEQWLERVATLDAGAQPDDLQRDLVRLRKDLRQDDLRPRLRRIAMGSTNVEARSRAERLAGILERIEEAYERLRDPGLLSMATVSIARTHLDGDEAILQWLPATATTYRRTLPLGDGRFRFMIVTAGREGPPMVVTDEGTPEELERRHPGIQFTHGD